jgi:hypothetical protein
VCKSRSMTLVMQGVHGHHTDRGKSVGFEGWKVFVWRVEYIVEPQASSACVIPLHLQYWLVVVASATEGVTRTKEDEIDEYVRGKHVEEIGGVGRYSDSLRAGRSGHCIPVETRFSAPVQTGPVAHPALSTMGAVMPCITRSDH